MNTWTPQAVHEEVDWIVHSDMPVEHGLVIRSMLLHFAELLEREEAVR